ncbi:MAG: hypothetical protein U1F65_03645 [Verrucomicrobiota bacterium]
MAKRYELTEAQFASIRDILPGKAGDPGRTAQDNHRFFSTDVLEFCAERTNDL